MLLTCKNTRHFYVTFRAVDAGGASPDNARRSGPALLAFIRRLARLARDDQPGQLSLAMLMFE
jgi:hypothetical protein